MATSLLHPRFDPAEVPDPASYLEESYASLPSTLTWVFFTGSPRLSELLDYIEEMNDIVDDACSEGLIPIPRARDNYGVRCQRVIDNLERLTAQNVSPLFRRFQELHELRFTFLPPRN